MRVSAQRLHRQLISVFREWGMSEPPGATTAEVMVESAGAPFVVTS
jgi:hypothetical protein